MPSSRSLEDCLFLVAGPRQSTIESIRRGKLRRCEGRFTFSPSATPTRSRTRRASRCSPTSPTSAFPRGPTARRHPTSWPSPTRSSSTPRARRRPRSSSSGCTRRSSSASGFRQGHGGSPQVRHHRHVREGRPGDEPDGLREVGGGRAHLLTMTGGAVTATPRPLPSSPWLGASRSWPGFASAGRRECSRSRCRGASSNATRHRAPPPSARAADRPLV
jgi:hypothetical protein